MGRLKWRACRIAAAAHSLVYWLDYRVDRNRLVHAVPRHNPFVDAFFRETLSTAFLLQSAQLSLHDHSRLRRDQITQRVRRIVAADSIFIGVDFQHVLRTSRIVQQRRDAIEQPRAAPVNDNAKTRQSSLFVVNPVAVSHALSPVGS